jgi:hypothetical protein
MRAISGLAIGSALALSLLASPGHASTVTDVFSFTDASNNVVAHGSFSYDSSLSGALSYSDLSSFNLVTDFAGYSYDLAFVNSANQYSYFGYDTVSNAFVPASVSGYDGSYYGILSAIMEIGGVTTGGFFFDPLVSQGGPGADGWVGDYHPAGQVATTVATAFTIAPVPLPPALPAFAAGLALFGLLGWRKLHASQA